jgi:hypothetical protein
MTSACSPMAIRGGWLQLLQTGSVMPVLKELCLRAVPSLLSSAWLLLVAPVECSEQRRPLPVGQSK